jgi:hypothetical protein
MLDTNEHQINILNQVKPYYLGYKKNLTFSIPDALAGEIQAIYKQFYGTSIPQCSSGKCMVKAIYTLLVESGVGVD